MMKRIIVCAQSQINVARRPPTTTYTAMPIGRRKQAAIMSMPVNAFTVAAPPTASTP